MNKNVLSIAAVAFILFSFIFVSKYIGHLRIENKRLQNNEKVLLDSMQIYKVSDSLNASKVNVLELSISKYKKYKAEDAALIKKLKADKISGTTSVNAITTTEIKTQLRDTIIYKDRVVPIDTLKQIKYDSKWTSLRGYLANDTLSLDIVNREELLLVESFVKKKFVGIKLPIWLFGYKTKSLDAVSKNPNTRITKLEYIQIYK